MKNDIHTLKDTLILKLRIGKNSQNNLFKLLTSKMKFPVLRSL